MSETKSHKTHKDRCPGFPFFEKATLVRGSGRCSFILRSPRIESGSTPPPSRIQEWRCAYKNPYPPSMNSLVDFQDVSRTALKVSQDFQTLNEFIWCAIEIQQWDRKGGSALTHNLRYSFTSLFYHRGGIQGVLRFNYFYITFDWQMLPNLLSFGGLFQFVPPGRVWKLHS